MKCIPFLITLGFALCAQAQSPSLPPSFKTSKGQTISNGKVMATTPTGVKIVHDSGIANLPNEELPPEVQSLLGIQAAAPQTFPDLPAQISIKFVTYQSAKIIGLDPDGIRITHSNGNAKINHEDLPPELVALVGPFDQEKAMVFRREEEAKLMQARAQAAEIARQMAGQKAALSEVTPEDSEPSYIERMKEDPNLLSMGLSIALSGSSSGGRSSSRYKDSSSIIDDSSTSNRKMTCHVQSRAGHPQRLRLQCIFLTRPVNGGDIQADVVADTLVNVGANSTATVVASASVDRVDVTANYIGLRFVGGGKYLGWCWRAIDGSGRVAAAHASISGYLRFAQSTPF